MVESILNNLEIYLKSGWLLAYLASFIGGILVSFTPCIYPIIPITVAYIGARGSTSRGKNFILSLGYSLGVALTYSILGIISALTGRLFGQIQNNPLTYFLVGNICIILGLSMFDIFTVPSVSLGAKIKLPRKISGIPGAFLMGLVAGLVMGPCTVPILAVLLAYVASGQSILFGWSLLFVFALGMSVVLIIIGTFAGFLTSLPKPGVWMNRIKKILGFGLIAVGEYFLIMMGKSLI